MMPALNLNSFGPNPGSLKQPGGLKTAEQKPMTTQPRIASSDSGDSFQFGGERVAAPLGANASNYQPAPPKFGSNGKNNDAPSSQHTNPGGSSSQHTNPGGPSSRRRRNDANANDNNSDFVPRQYRRHVGTLTPRQLRQRLDNRDSCRRFRAREGTKYKNTLKKMEENAKRIKVLEKKEKELTAELLNIPAELLGTQPPSSSQLPSSSQPPSSSQSKPEEEERPDWFGEAF